MAWTTTYYDYDGMGNVVALTDESGQPTGDQYVYTAFGEFLGGSVITENSFLYQGRVGYYHDGFETGEYYLPTRTYAPEFARWQSIGPRWDYQGLNSYAYAENRPTQTYEMLGLFLGVLPIPDYELPPYPHPPPATGDSDEYRDWWNEANERRIRLRLLRQLEARGGNDCFLIKLQTDLRETDITNVSVHQFFLGDCPTNLAMRRRFRDELRRLVASFLPLGRWCPKRCQCLYGDAIDFSVDIPLVYFRQFYWEWIGLPGFRIRIFNEAFDPVFGFPRRGPCWIVATANAHLDLSLLPGTCTVAIPPDPGNPPPRR